MRRPQHMYSICRGRSGVDDAASMLLSLPLCAHKDTKSPSAVHLPVRAHIQELLPYGAAGAAAIELRGPLLEIDETA